MESLGEFLKHGREEAGLTLEELAQRTRIRIENLEALEREDLDSLPTDIYVRGFVKLVCREVGAAPEDGLARYESLRSTAGPADEIIWSEEQEVTEPGWLERVLRDPERVVRTATSAVKWGGLALGGVLILLVVVVGVKALRSDDEASAPVPAVAEPKAAPEREQADPPKPETTKPAEVKKAEVEKSEPKKDPPKTARAEPRSPKKKPEPLPPVELALVEPEIPERKPAGTIEAGDPVAAAEELAAEQAAAEKRAEERAAAEKLAMEEAAADREAAAERRRATEQAAADKLAREKAAAEKAVAVATPPPETARAAAPKPSPPSPSPARATSDERLVLVVEALRAVEVEVLLDGVGHPRSRDLTPGESKTWKADSLFLLSATDGGAVRITLDGVDLGVPGRDGEPLLNRPVRRRR